MTPIRRQYLRIKQNYPDAIVLFRLGDFYETFDDDARLASRDLDIVLTSKSMGKNLKVPLAGIPAHSVESYLARLIKKGHRVAICEQLSDPAASKGLVERDVVRVVTPGTVLEPSLLDQRANNYLVAVVVVEDDAGLSYVDITTGEFSTTQLSTDELAIELSRLAPSEVVVPEGLDLPWGAGEYMVTSLSPSAYDYDRARQTLLEHFGVVTLESFGCANLPLAVRTAGAVLEYLAKGQLNALKELDTLSSYSTSAFMALDRQTRRNLEIFQGGRWDSSGPSLLSTLDLTRTPMGGRLFRRWIGLPLLDIEELMRRQDAVSFFYANLLRRQTCLTLLSQITDMERVISRVRLGVAVPREIASLKTSLESAAVLLPLFQEEGAEAIAWLKSKMQPCDDIVALIDVAISSEPGSEPGEGTVIKEGFSPELDELRLASRNAREYIAGLEQRERKRSGIRTLKVSYNKVFGYYIEVSNPNLSQVPTDYTRRQTLVGGERFITPELKEYESLILNARERIEEMERALFRQICGQIGERAQAISSLADGVGHLDVFAALAEVASRHGYVRPRLTEAEGIEIRAGRHPVVEQVMPPGTFVPNDTCISSSDSQLVILTGPNMAGKSTYHPPGGNHRRSSPRPASFVPARVGRRSASSTGCSRGVGASGQSVDVAKVHLHGRNERDGLDDLSTMSPIAVSLLILDELGRGTSTYRWPFSIARSVAEYVDNIFTAGPVRPRTLFATHYHELTQLGGILPRVRNYTVAVSEDGGEVVFLHRIVPGGADKSYGIHVARLAGLPGAVINRAWEALRDLEGDGHHERNPGHVSSKRAASLQMPLFNESSQLVEEVLQIDPSNMTPLEAINKLYELQQKARDSKVSSRDEHRA